MSYIADPPATPIDIDGGIEYNYVIAQQGFIRCTVDDDDDFTFRMGSLGEPTMLRLTFTGTTGANALYRTVTINLTDNAGLVQTHTPYFRILPTGDQNVPNITTNKGRQVNAGQYMAIQIDTDIDATSYSSSTLPGTLSLNTSTGLITGTAPTSSSYNVVTLIAINGDYSYSRYYAITVGTGMDAPEDNVITGVPRA